jgi:hypothetical protein
LPNTLIRGIHWVLTPTSSSSYPSTSCRRHELTLPNTLQVVISNQTKLPLHTRVLVKVLLSRRRIQHHYGRLLAVGGANLGTLDFVASIPT